MKPKLIVARLATSMKRFRYGEQPHPVRDWLILLSITLVLVLAAGGWSYYLVERIGQGESHAATATTTPVNAGSIATVRAIFENRAEQRARFLSDYHLVDPSK